MAPQPPTLEEQLAQLLELLNDRQNPNINVLWQIAKDIEGIKLNLKVFGYDLARRLRSQWPERRIDGPSKVGLCSKLCTQADMEATWLTYWAGKLGIDVIYHRKIWELCYVMQSLWERDLLKEGSRGLGFGCGLEPIPSLLAALNCDVTMTDLETEDARSKGWLATQQHVTHLEQGLHPHLVDRETFLKRVNHAFVDMNSIPASLRDFDFCWSICSLEHLGSIANGLAFIENSLDTLRPGGVAVHTTEFNVLNDRETIDNWATVLFQRKHFEAMAEHLTARGHTIAPFDFDIGNGPMDRFIDLPPYDHDLVGPARQAWSGATNHLKLTIDGFASTCFGLIIERGTRT
jgi:SAM-dependent methyltransferase